MKFTQIPVDTFREIQSNAGILVDNFNPATGVIGNLLGATTGGVNFTDTPEFTDYGEDIDNCPKNMMELKKLQNREVKITGNMITMSAQTAKTLVGAADVDAADATHIIPRNDLLVSDFSDLWWIGDYSDVNTGDNAGYVAIHMMNVLNTSGFQIQSTDKAKGQFAFEYTGHYSMDAQSVVPYELYIKQGETEPVPVTPSVTINKDAVTLEPLATETLTATTVPSDATVAWTSSDLEVATVSDEGVVSAVAVGEATITATITVEATDYTDTCTVTVSTD